MSSIAKCIAVIMAMLAGFAAVGSADGAERFVDNSGVPPCSNSMPGGTEARPWCTITYAMARAEPGDVVYVKKGNYREDVYIDRKHGGPTYITLQNFPGHAPVIVGAGVDSGRNKITSSSFIKIVGMAITNANQGLFVEQSNNIVLSQLKVFAVGQEAIHIKANSSFVVLEDSEIFDTRKWKYNGEGVYIGTSTSQQPANPPYDNTHDIVVKNNKIYNTADECIEAKEGTYNVTIDGNTLSDCLLSPEIKDPNWGSIELMAGGKFLDANPNHVVSNNKIRTAKTAIGLHTGAIVFNNVISGQTGDYRGISISNPASDSHVRHVYGNRIELSTAKAVVVSGKPVVRVRDNTGLNGEPLP